MRVGSASLGAVGFVVMLAAGVAGCSSPEDPALDDSGGQAVVTGPAKASWKLGELPAAHEGQLGASSWIAYAGVTTDDAGAARPGIFAYGINSEGDVSAVVFHDLVKNRFAVWENKSRTNGCLQGSDTGCVAVSGDLLDVYVDEYKHIVSLAAANGKASAAQAQALEPLAATNRADACVFGALGTLVAGMGVALTVAAVASGAAETVGLVVSLVGMVGAPIAIAEYTSGNPISLADLGSTVVSAAKGTGDLLKTCAVGA